MTQKNETGVLILSLLVTAGILGGGYWWFIQKSGQNPGTILNNTQTSPSSPSSPTPLPSPPSPSIASNFPFPTSVASGTTVRVDGATSMVLINEALKKSFQQQFPGTQVLTEAKGSDKGIIALLTGTIDVAALSRPLTADEQKQGLVAVPVAKDAIAIVVGLTNPYGKGLTATQVTEIFQGKITDWSALGESAGTLRVINRPSESGTRQVFRELVLMGSDFGNSANFTTLPRDATTPMLQALGSDGIGYATYAQVANQQTVRTVPIDGLTPEAANYPYQRTLYYVYKEPANESAKAFLGYATSPNGQQVIINAQ